MSNDKSNETGKIVIDTTILRNDAGKRLNTDKNNSGITKQNEGTGSGISLEFFTKDGIKSPSSSKKENTNKVE